MTSKHAKKLQDARYNAISERKEWLIIERAKHALLDAAVKLDITIYSVEYVASFEDWDKGIGVYVFFPKDADLQDYIRSGATKVLEVEYLSILKKLDYPFDKYPDVNFMFDSDENVQKNFEGSYFFRLR